MQDNKRKLRYFVIGEDKPFNNKKVVKCRDFGITEVECTPNAEIQSSACKNNIAESKMPETINCNSYFGGLFDSMKSMGITIVTSDDMGK